MIRSLQSLRANTVVATCVPGTLTPLHPLCSKAEALASLCGDGSMALETNRSRAGQNLCGINGLRVAPRPARYGRPWNEPHPPFVSRRGREGVPNYWALEKWGALHGAVAPGGAA